MALLSVLRGGKRARRLHAALEATPRGVAFQLASVVVFIVMLVIVLPLYLRVYRPSVEWEQGIELRGFTGSPEEEALLPRSYDAPLESRVEVGRRSGMSVDCRPRTAAPASAGEGSPVRVPGATEPR
jgi:hypothetical protein